MTSVTPYWAVVENRDRVFSDAGTDKHKMGWLNLGDRVRVIEVYRSTWARFDQTNGEEVHPFEEGYKQWWTQAVVRAGVPSEPEPTEPTQPEEPTPEEPTPEPIPTQPGDEALGAALRILGEWVRDLIRGWAA